jgi:hypothetical protein
MGEIGGAGTVDLAAHPPGGSHLEDTRATLGVR